MPDPKHTENQPGPQTEQSRPPQPMEDEEKILAGRADVNMPALLTKDVQGG